MIIFPAIDLRGGHCVRLYKGDFSKEEITYIGEYRFKHSTGILKEDERLEYGLQTFINMI